MCGIIFAHIEGSHKQGNLFKSLWKRYKNQSSRGTQGFGYVCIDDNGKIGEVKRFKTESEVEKSLKEESANTIMFHHRFPTSTPNIESLNHPIVVKHDSLDHDYYVIHNGIIRNDTELRDKHEKLGFIYTTLFQTITTEKCHGYKKEKIEEKYNDSEALAIELARYFDGDQAEIGATGSIAFNCIQTDKEGNVLKIFFGRNSGNPLIAEKAGNMNFVKSEGNGEAFAVDTIHIFNYQTKKINAYEFKVGTHYAYAPSSPHSGYSNWDKDDLHEANRAGFNLPNHQTSLLPSKIDTKKDRYWDEKSMSWKFKNNVLLLGDEEMESSYEIGNIIALEKEIDDMEKKKDSLLQEIADYEELSEDMEYSMLVKEELNTMKSNLENLEYELDNAILELSDICEETGYDSDRLYDYEVITEAEEEDDEKENYAG